MIFHIPHASFDIPFDLRSSLLLDDESLMDELRVMTDAFTDDLFGSHAGMARIWLYCLRVIPVWAR
jgi:hypothetical protein